MATACASLYAYFKKSRLALSRSAMSGFARPESLYGCD